jgi:hypothetical protein
MSLYKPYKLRFTERTEAELSTGKGEMQALKEETVYTYTIRGRNPRHNSDRIFMYWRKLVTKDFHNICLQ